MQELNNLMNAFINKELSMNEYVSKIKDFSICNKDLFNDFLSSYNKTNKMDQRMNALLILWFFKNDLFNLDNPSNPYLSYISEITEDIINPTASIITLENDYMICKVNQFYFIINHNDDEVEINLPSELVNKTVYCYNCNDDMDLEETIFLPEFSFYALEAN